jgi:hypothetical protein
MNQRFSALIGVVLILTGALASTFSLDLAIPGLSIWPFRALGLWRLWPLTVVGVGLLFVLPPFLAALARPGFATRAGMARRKRGLGILFIPGMPILTTGAILLLASVCDWWRVWKWLWPQEVLALAFGLLFAAIYARRTWLLVPAIIIWLNGVLLQFCALTGLWEVWAVLWTVEPLAVGLALLVIGGKTRSSGLLTAGFIVCGLAGLALIGMTTTLQQSKTTTTLRAGMARNASVSSVPEMAVSVTVGHHTLCATDNRIQIATNHKNRHTPRIGIAARPQGRAAQCLSGPAPLRRDNHLLSAK